MSEKASETNQKLPQGMAAERQIDDFCLSCDGRCCKHFTIKMKPNELMRGLISVHMGTAVDWVKFHVKHVCRELDDDGRCKLWHEDEKKDARPDFCKNFLCDRAKERMIVIECGDQDIEV